MAYTSFKQFALLPTWRGRRMGCLDGRLASGTGRGWSCGHFPCLPVPRNDISEADYLKRVSEAFDWRSIDLAEVKPSVEARRKISSKVASQYSVLPVTMKKACWWWW